MKLGATVPRDALPDGHGQALNDVADVAERAGLASLWMSDHLLMVDGAAGYPYTKDNSFGRGGATPWFESLSVLSWLAARSTTLNVGTSVLILPQRNPLELAKITATIDYLSRGRLLIGVGGGWLREEFEVLGYDFASRGERLDSAIDVMRQAWTGHVPAGDYGNVHVAHDVYCHPLPYRKPGVSLLVGGMSGRARRRVAEKGDGWLARAWIDELVDDPTELAGQLEQVLSATERIGARQQYNVLRIVTRDGKPAVASDGSLDPLLTRAVRAAREIGFDEAAFDIAWSNAGIESELRQLGEAVV